MKLKRFGNSIKTFSLIIFLILSFITLTSKSFAQTTSNLKFDVSFPSEIYDSPITGRVYLIISKDENREPRFQVRRSASPPFFGKDVVQLNPGQAAVIDDAVLGFPLNSIKDIPPGEYYAQGFINIYTKFKRSDGHTIYLHNDQWEGQQWNRSPGNLYSDVLKVNIDPSFSQTIQLSCKNVIPPIKIPPDTKWVKRIRIKSKILSDFWGQSIYLGATILLPKDYEKNRHRRYPVNYIQGHFSLRAPNGFRTEQPDKKDRRGNRGYEFYKSWIADDSPRMIFVTFQHPCPYFDDSYAVNSANCGPYGDAIMKELIPTIESRFRIIQKPYARVLEGGSTGGWEALVLQLFQADFFGGAFIYCPDPVDFRDVEGVHIYNDKNAFHRKIGWRSVPIPDSRRINGSLILTSQQIQQYELVLGTNGRSGEQWDIWQAVYGPIRDDGYPELLINKNTGEINPEVAKYWKDNYDLRNYLEKNWATLGPKIKDKLYFFTGDMDTYYLNNPVHLLQQFMEQTSNPHYPGYFVYGPRAAHCWRGHFTIEERLAFIANHIANNTPETEKISWWTQK